MSVGAPRPRAALRGPLAESALLALILALPLILAAGNSYRIFLSALMAIYAGTAIGLTVLLGVARQFHLGQAAFMAVGAYAAAIISERLGAELPYELIAAIIVGGLLGLAVGLVTLRLSGLYFALATLALVLGVSSLAENWQSLTHGATGFSAIPPVRLVGAALSAEQTYMVVAILLLAQGALIFNLKRSSYWGALKLIGDRDYLASCVGIRVFWYRTLAFVLVSMVAACWGVLFAHVVGYIDPATFGVSLTIALLMMVVLGGLGSFWGALLGAVLLVQIPEWLASSGSEQQLIYGGILLAGVLVFPRGLIPSLRDAPARIAGLRGRRSAQPQELPGAQEVQTQLLAGDISFDGAALQVSEIAIKFGGVQALRGASLTADAGRVEGLIGPNGSGKTTMLNIVSGVASPDSGSVLLDGVQIAGTPAHEIAHLGLMRTFQTPQVVLEMTVLENAVLGWHQRRSSGLLSASLGLGSARREQARHVREAAHMCTELGLGGMLDTRASELSTGERRFVEIARALGSRPRLLFLDEPATGLTGLERERLMAVLQRLRSAGLTLVVIDHDMEFLFQAADHLTVLDRGANIAVGAPDEIRESPAVIDAYFGESIAHA